MPYAILAFDKPNTNELRAQVRAEHLAYLEQRKHLILAGGPLLDDDGRPLGGMQVIDTESGEVAEEFAAGDPFRKAGLFESVQVVRWRKVFFNYESAH